MEGDFLKIDRLLASGVIHHEAFLFAIREEVSNEILAGLLDRGMDMENMAGTGRTGLHVAITEGTLEHVEYLAEKGANLEAVMEVGNDWPYNEYEGHTAM